MNEKEAIQSEVIKPVDTRVAAAPPHPDPDIIPLPAARPTAAPAPELPPGWFGPADAALWTLVLVMAFLVGSFAATNSDVWMNLASGRLIAQGQWEVGADPFSFAPDKGEWVQHNWLYSLVLYHLYSWFGGTALVVIKALLAVGLALCLLGIRTPRSSRLFGVLGVGLTVLVVSPNLLLSSLVVSLLFLGLTLLILHRAGALSNGALSNGALSNGALSDGAAAEVSPEVKPQQLWRLPLLFLLWANLDAWFILGPLTVLFVWLGALLGQALGVRSAVPARTLGLVFLLGLLACVVNPFHIKVFQLPPELAYLLVRAGNAFGLTLPDFLFAGGKTLVFMQSGDIPIGMSPLAKQHITNASQGLNVAGLSFFVLWLLSLASFVVGAVLLGLRGLRFTRLAPWVVLALLSLFQTRFVAFFAILAGPFLVLNLENLAGRQSAKRPTRHPVPSSWLGGKLARGLGFAAFLLLLFLAWPGWLHARLGDFSAPRRVSWTMEPDSALRDCVQGMDKLGRDRETLHVFNFSPDAANYCAWFAPNVQCFFDRRFALFPGQAKAYAALRRDLWDYGDLLSMEWKAGLHSLGIDVVLISSSRDSAKDYKLAQRCWLNPDVWTERYDDGRYLVVAWNRQRTSGPSRADLVAAKVFGEVPPADRPPAGGTPLVEGRGFWEQYLDGTPRNNTERLQSHSESLYFKHQSDLWQNYLIGGNWIADRSLGGSVAILPRTLYGLAFLNNLVATQAGHRRPDFGPSASALQAVRQGRRAVAATPFDDGCYLALHEAYQWLMVQENYWSPGQPTALRQRIREAQSRTALWTAVQLNPTDYDLRLGFAGVLLQASLLDAGLEHLREALRLGKSAHPSYEGLEKIEEKLRAKERVAAKSVQLAQLEHSVKVTEESVKQRMGDLDQEMGQKPANRFFKAWLVKPYQYTDRNNKDVQDRNGMGLVLEALKSFAKIPWEELNVEEKAQMTYWRFSLLIELGQGAQIASELPKHEDALRGLPLQSGMSGYQELRLLLAAAQGDYAECDKILVEIEPRLDMDLLAKASGQAIAKAQELQLLDALPLGPKHFHMFFHAGSSQLADPRLPPSLFQVRVDASTALRRAADVRILRAMIALEAADNIKAQQLFREALKLAGPVPLPERVLAERYLRFLDKYMPKSQ